MIWNSYEPEWMEFGTVEHKPFTMDEDGVLIPGYLFTLSNVYTHSIEKTYNILQSSFFVGNDQVSRLRTQNPTCCLL
jgi:hypothetical protein